MSPRLQKSEDVKSEQQNKWDSRIYINCIGRDLRLKFENSFFVASKSVQWKQNYSVFVLRGHEKIFGHF